MKCRHGVISNKACEKFMEVRKFFLPTSDKVPVIFFFFAQDQLSLDCKKIDICPNGCMMHYREYKDDKLCYLCKTSPWKIVEKNRREKGK